MKNIKNLIFTINFLFLHLSVSSQKSGEDTSFILRENKSGIYHAVFIEDTKKDKYYNSISNFKLTEFEKKNYSSSIKFYVDEHKIPVAKTNLSDCPKQWCPLYLYKGNYYVYSPYNYLRNNRVDISDSTFTDFTADGPSPLLINSFLKKDSNTFKFNLNYYGSETITIIHIIYKERGIAVFENASADSDNEYKYYLMIRADSVRNFPVVVNYANKEIIDEFQFEKPDFKKLLN